MNKLAILLVAAVIAGIAAVACHSNPDVDGSGVPTVGSLTSAPTCTDVCNRLIALCGYAPADCTTPDAGGYCDLNFTDDAERICIGFGTADDAGVVTETRSCQAAWDCVNNEPAPDDSTDDDAASGDDAATDDDAGDTMLDGGND